MYKSTFLTKDYKFLAPSTIYRYNIDKDPKLADVKDGIIKMERINEILYIGSIAAVGYMALKNDWNINDSVNYVMGLTFLSQGVTVVNFHTPRYYETAVYKAKYIPYNNTSIIEFKHPLLSYDTNKGYFNVWATQRKYDLETLGKFFAEKFN